MKKRIGVYVHVPFCSGKCAYCDFYSLAGRDKQMPAYEEAVIRHIREYSPQLDGCLIDTVYFGGGTPTALGADRLIAIFDALKKYGNVLVDSEVTLEANPESCGRQELIRLRKAGFNRISIGMQSGNDRLLETLGRRHNFARVEEAVVDAREAGFKNVSLDLLYGLPAQSRDDWAGTLAKAAALKPDHMSCYGLKLEKGTPMYILRDSPFLPDDDTQADMYLYAVEALARYGFRQYEISNFARRGMESVHNLKYWRCEEYIGLGPAAHSYMNSRRYSNIADLDEYIGRMTSGGSVIDQMEIITEQEKASEYIMLGMRTTMGIADEEYRRLDPMGMEEIARLLEEFNSHGWAVRENGRWRLTPEGFLLSNTLIGELLEAQARQRMLWKRRTDPVDDMQMRMTGMAQEPVPVFKGM